MNSSCKTLLRIMQTKLQIEFALATIAAVCSIATTAEGADAKRPNILWIMSEDNSKHYLRHFDTSGAATPAIESLAKHGVTFDRAFSCSPVCSVARTTLITSCYGPRIGTQFHRRSKMAEMPSGLKMFPAYLRAAGYYTTNNSKQDYNAVKTDDVWNESSRKASWKNRPSESTPFFHVLTSTLSHESSLHFDRASMATETATDPDSVQLQPYFPDTPTFRYTRARYHDRIQAIDQVVQSTLDDLQSAGQLENTFVFYFGDHGGVLPRSKGYAYESGLHVPLIVRVPENYRALAGRDLGTRTSGFVEFVDFGPTVLALAGIDPPHGIDGDAFLGGTVDPQQVDARNEAFGYADRFDEKYDFVRTLRQGNWKYMRHFEPFLPDALQNNYRYKMLAYQQWRRLFREGKLNGVQRQFFEAKPIEALYDLQVDPHETNNLASHPQQTDRLVSMRDRLSERLKAMPDLSFLPEAVLYDQAMSHPVDFGQQHKSEIGQLIDTVNLSLMPYQEVEAELKRALDSDKPWMRYWALVACSSFGDQAKPLLPVGRRLLDDPQPLVVMRAVEFVALVGESDPRPPLYRAIEKATNEPEALRLLNTAVFLNDFTDGRLPIDVEKIEFGFEPKPRSELLRRTEYLAE